MDSIARYLDESAEPEAALADRISGSFGHAVEIPAYGERESLAGTLASVPAGSRDIEQPGQTRVFQQPAGPRGISFDFIV